MPKQGYKSITVQQKIYDYFMRKYESQKDKLAIHDGIKSFSGYVTWRLAQMIEQDEKQHQK